MSALTCETLHLTSRQGGEPVRAPRLEFRSLAVVVELLELVKFGRFDALAVKLVVTSEGFTLDAVVEVVVEASLLPDEGTGLERVRRCETDLSLPPYTRESTGDPSSKESEEEDGESGTSDRVDGEKVPAVTSRAECVWRTRPGSVSVWFRVCCVCGYTVCVCVDASTQFLCRNGAETA